MRELLRSPVRNPYLFFLKKKKKKRNGRRSILSFRVFKRRQRSIDGRERL